MTRFVPAREIADAFQAACRLELQALKPGNVHVHAAGHGMQTGHFERASAASAEHIAAAGVPVGTRIRRAVEASFDVAGCNTNLGIILLCAPLACAAGESQPGDDLRARLSRVLLHLDQGDASEAFAAIAHANPGGLGRTDAADVSEPATVTLLEAMRLAASRDRIARAYITNFADIFEIGLPVYRAALTRAQSPELAVTTLHMHYLAHILDTHIVRKYGEDLARNVQADARALASQWQPVTSNAAIPALLDFDSRLKRDAINPGTTADFVVATIFTERLIKHLASPAS
jgi:triphosphoribosyl-dephospho-CoA synthase